MPRTAPKKYKVTVSYCENTPEEAERLRAEITDVIYRCKMLAMKTPDVPEKEAVNT